MRTKTFFAVAFAFVMMLGGIAVSAQTMDIYANMDVDLRDNLTAAATEGTSFGYRTPGGTFQSLSVAMSTAPDAADGTGRKSVYLGNFSSGNSFQFGYAGEGGSNFSAAVVNVKSDPGYVYTYNPDKFYTLDFSNKEFNGNIEVLAVGTPLPPSTVTLLVALGVAAALLLYRNRRNLARSEQA